MNNKQKFTPKYWVVHDKATSDVFIETADNSMFDSIQKFLHRNAYEYFGTVDDYEAKEMFLYHPSLDCSLVEIKLVEMEE